MSKKLQGIVKEVRGSPRPNSYIIEDQNGKTYLTHLGDIKENEDLLYELSDQDKITLLKKDDLVEFQAESEHAIHVKKLTHNNS